MQVHYFALDTALAEKILVNYLPTDWSVARFNPGESVQVVFLQSPVWCNKHYVSVDLNWKNYLAKHHPEAKLISFGVQPAEHPNYLDLLQPPENFTIFLDAAGTCSENWTPLRSCGLDMNQKLKRFFDGHGSESVQESFSTLLRRFRIVRDEVAGGTSYQEVYRELLQPTQTPATWQKLVNRWQAYSPFFTCLPFLDLFQGIDQLLMEVQPFFNQECRPHELLQNLKIIDKIETVNQLLTEAQQYVQK